MTKKEMEFLGGRMRQLREKNGVKSLESMRELLTASGNDDYRVDNKSTLSRAESGSAGEKTIIKRAKAYCDVFGYSEKQTFCLIRYLNHAGTGCSEYRPCSEPDLSADHSRLRRQCLRLYYAAGIHCHADYEPCQRPFIR